MASFKQMDKVLSLVAKTGDKVIVVSEAQEPYVIMTFSEYDRLLLGNSGVNNLTEEELLNKINKDIAIWKSVQVNSDYDLDEFKVDDLDKISTPNKKNEEKSVKNLDNTDSEEEDKYYIEPID